jgi:hypothetical protein
MSAQGQFLTQQQPIEMVRFVPEPDIPPLLK